MANIIGTNGNDSGFFTLSGSDDDDTIQGLDGDDALVGISGNDLLDGGKGQDIMVGGSDDDTYIVDSFGDKVFEFLDDGIDLIKTSESFTLPDNVENLTLLDFAFSGTGNDLDNIIIANSGNNFLTGGLGSDTIDGGDGIDSLIEGGDFNFGLTDTKLTAASFKLSNLSVNIDTLSNIERAFLTGGGSDNTIDASGFSGDVRLTGLDGEDILVGGSGDDDFVGGAGDDQINGGAGIDTVIAEGDVNYSLTNTKLTGLGTDTLVSIEQARIFGGDSANTLNTSLFNGSVNLFGNSGGDTLLGGSGGDRLEGGGGGDIFAGGAGNDSLDGNGSESNGDGAQDKFVFNTGVAFSTRAGTATIGIDDIEDFEQGFDKIVLDKSTYTTLNSAVGSGFSVASEFAVVDNDRLVSTSAAQIVYNSSTEKLFYNQNGTSRGLGTGGQFASFSHEFNNQKKTTLSASDFEIQSHSLGGLNNGTPIFIVAQGVASFTGTAVSGIIQGNSSSNKILSKGGDDVVLGGKGDDYMDGGTGDDLLFGGKDNDTLKGGKGNDTFVLALNNGTDVIKDFQDGSDRLGLVGNLTVAGLQISQQGSSAQISSDGNVLAKLNGINASQLDATDFVQVDFTKFQGMSVPKTVG